MTWFAVIMIVAVAFSLISPFMNFLIKRRDAREAAEEQERIANLGISWLQELPENQMLTIVYAIDDKDTLDNNQFAVSAEYMLADYMNKEALSSVVRQDVQHFIQMHEDGEIVSITVPAAPLDQFTMSHMQSTLQKALPSYHLDQPEWSIHRLEKVGKISNFNDSDEEWYQKLDAPHRAVIERYPLLTALNSDLAMPVVVRFTLPEGLVGRLKDDALSKHSGHALLVQADAGIGIATVDVMWYDIQFCGRQYVKTIDYAHDIASRHSATFVGWYIA